MKISGKTNTTLNKEALFYFLFSKRGSFQNIEIYTKFWDSIFVCFLLPRELPSSEKNVRPKIKLTEFTKPLERKSVTKLLAFRHHNFLVVLIYKLFFEKKLKRIKLYERKQNVKPAWKKFSKFEKSILKNNLKISSKIGEFIFCLRFVSHSSAFIGQQGKTFI